MAKRIVDPNELGSGAPKVEVADLDGNDAMVCTVAGYDTADVDDPEKPSGKRKTAWVTFEETGEKRCYLNKTQASALVARLGNDPDEWAGELCPVEVYTPKFGNKKYEPKVGVMDADDWDKALEEVGAGPKSRKRTVTKVRPPVAKKRQ